MKKVQILLLGFLFILITPSLKGQDTLKIAQYNLLYYGLNDVGCDAINNSVSEKTDYLKTIVEFIRPDIFAVNEINADVSVNNYHDYLLGSVFLYNGFPNYDRGEVNGSYLTSQIYYNKTKLTLKSEAEINSWPRDIHVYKFYYNSPDLTYGDTVYFTYYLAHLKAGNEPDDISDRNDAANDIMSYINYNNSGQNYILSGDLNLYTNTEGAYQRLTNYSISSINFIDVKPSGNWHDNETYADIHTQSAFYSTNKGCGAGGGLDDRFDFILFSQAIDNNSNQMSYISNSYKTIGQDGNHLNIGVSTNGNNSVPSDVLTALAYNSDHLPVYSEFFINQTPANTQRITNNQKTQIKCSIQNKILTVIFLNNSLLNYKTYINIYDITGRRILQKEINTNKNTTSYQTNINNLSQGIYIIHITNNNQTIHSTKIFL